MGRRLKSIGEVFSETWELYKRRAVPILVVILLTTLLVIFLICALGIIMALGLGGQQALTGQLQGGQVSTTTVIAGLVVFLVSMILIIWSQASTVAVTVDEDLGIMAALKAGWKYLIPLTWVGTLYMGIVMTGLTLFLLPGLILGLSMSLCFYIMIDEDLHGMDAVLASRQYVRGHWWNTFLKFFPVWLASIAVGLIPFIGQILSFIFTPFLLLYMVVVYRDLKEAAGEVDLRTGSRWLWALMAAVGIVLPLLGLVGAVVTLGPQLPEMMKQVQEGKIPGMDLPRLHDVPQSSTSGKKNASPVARRLQSVDGSWIWRDPTGDTNNPLLDIKEVSVKSGQEELLLTVTLGRMIDHYFAAAEASTLDPLVSFYLDTDVNRETGGDPLAGSGRSGYDVILDVLLEARPQDAGKGKVHVSLYTLDGRDRQSLGALDDTAVTVSGNTLKIRLPYILLHVAGKDTIRGCYREAGQQQGSGLAKDKLIPLK